MIAIALALLGAIGLAGVAVAGVTAVSLGGNL